MTLILFQKKVFALQLSLWLIIIIAAYNSVLGMIGGIYFIRTGYLTVHFFIAVVFGILAFSIFSKYIMLTVLFLKIVKIYYYCILISV